MTVDTEGNVKNFNHIDDDSGSYGVKILQSSLNLLARILIGITVGVSLLFSFRFGVPLGATMLHIVLCVIGYQLLMAEAILCLCPNSGWDHLRLVDRKRAHTVMQIIGSALAIAGSIIKALDKSINWNTLHGQFGLVAMVFTTVSLVNGLTSLYAYELRKCLPATLSKVTHILFGIVAFVTSGISLCYSFDKFNFMNWTTPAFAYTLMAFTGCFTLILIVNPFINFFAKTFRAVK